MLSSSVFIRALKESLPVAEVTFVSLLKFRLEMLHNWLSIVFKDEGIFSCFYSDLSFQMHSISRANSGYRESSGRARLADFITDSQFHCAWHRAATFLRGCIYPVILCTRVTY